MSISKLFDQQDRSSKDEGICGTLMASKEQFNNYYSKLKQNRKIDLWNKSDSYQKYGTI